MNGIGMWLKISILSAFVWMLNLSCFAQNDSISYHTKLFFLTANNSFQPHWQVSNRYGIFDRAKKNEFVGLFGIAYDYHVGKKFHVETEVEFNLKSEISSSYFQQLFMNLHYGALQLKIGKEAYMIGQYSEDLGAGSLFLSNNARPIPKVGGGFYQYTPVPLIGNYMEFKGAMNFGILDDDRSAYNGTDKPWFHEKFLYGRSKGLPVNLHVGLNHSAQLGGTLFDGRKIETDLIATFFGKGSSKLGGGEETNVAGAHFGLYDVGLNWKIKNSEFQFYFQKPFSDGSGKSLRSKDKVVGLLFNSNKKGFISNVIYEYINTMHQSGRGTPDPMVNGKWIVPHLIEDFDQYMLDNFDTVTLGMTIRDFVSFMSITSNYGYEFGGRDDHYNNGFYPMGLTYHDQNIGNSLLTNKKDMEAIHLEIENGFNYFFVNNRIVAHHLAFDGYISNKFSYRAKFTYTDNYGTYRGANKGRSNWASIEDPEYYNSYYFKDGLKQGYTYIELNYTPKKWKGIGFNSSFAYDFGEMYHNFGVLFGFSYNDFFHLGKKM